MLGLGLNHGDKIIKTYDLWTHYVCGLEKIDINKIIIAPVISNWDDLLIASAL